LYEAFVSANRAFVHRIIICSAAAVAAVVLPAPARAQEIDTQLWSTTTASFDLGNDLTFIGQFVARFSDDADGVSELQYQGDLELELREGLRVGGGYSYVPRYDQGDLTTREHRIRQQVSARLGSLAGGRVEGRLRLEQRWRDDGDDTALRLRPRVTWTRPIGPNDLALRLSHESFIFLNDTDWAGEAGYNRMRNQASLRRKLGSSATGELGYLNQYDLQPGRRDRMAHVLTLGLSFDF
jgi:hypothetical protein